nr:RNA-directed DNA polymerase, eukaryota [Tanacetum cinerariifolium]
DSCVAERDLSNHVMGNVKDVSSISNLRTLIMEEGFSVVNLVYLGGILLNVWSRETFTRIGKKWGEALDIEDNVDSSFGRKRGPNDDRVSDVEEVSETNFGDNSSIPINHIDELEKKQSEDPFNIYRLLRKQPGDDSHEVSSSLSHPPGFTPDVSVIRNENGQSAKKILVVGGSVLEVMEDMIRVGKAMGYLMDGCVKDLEQIIRIQRVGNSGGILCVWEAMVFKKEYATILDNFVAIYGKWLPSNSKVFFVAIYAPQQVSRKRLLWDYVSTLIDHLNGEVVVLGDFNEVRNIDERRGSCFNPTCARFFDQFISASGLVDVKMKGYTFICSHPSGSKMSKLDRFLVSECIFSIFPSITAVCLDRHLSDHRPIILCEVQADFGPIPF